MKNKFIALLCMAAMWINTSVTASEGVYVRTEEGNTEVSDVLSDTERGIGVTENTDLFAESDADGENEKYLPAAEGSTSEITDLKIESNQGSKITSDSTETLQETGMEELKRLISELENCNPGERQKAPRR